MNSLHDVYLFCCCPKLVHFMCTVRNVTLSCCLVEQQHSGRLILICVLGYWFLEEWDYSILCCKFSHFCFYACMQSFIEMPEVILGRWCPLCFDSSGLMLHKADLQMFFYRSSQFPHYPIWHACNFLRVKTNLPATP